MRCHEYTHAAFSLPAASVLIGRTDPRAAAVVEEAEVHRLLDGRAAEQGMYRLRRAGGGPHDLHVFFFFVVLRS